MIQSSLKKVLVGVLTLASLFSFSACNKTSMTDTVIMETTLGTIEIGLDGRKAPVSVENFLKYVDDGFFNGTVFHRVIDKFMIQGGGFTKDGDQKQTRTPIKNEADNGLKNLRGTIAMARTSQPDSATSQFFINTVDNAFLDHGARDFGYAVFGQVTSGMDVVDKIEKVETVGTPMPNWPKDTVEIISVKRK